MTEYLLNRMCDTALPPPDMGTARRVASARKRYPALTPYATPRAIADRLARDDFESDERRAMVRAIVELYRTKPCALWCDLVIRSFQYLLLGIRAEVHLGRLQADDVDQQMIDLFLRLVRAYDLDKVGHFLAHAIGRDLRRDLFRALQRERRELDWIDCPAAFGEQVKHYYNDDDRLEARAIWSSVTRDRDPVPLAEHLLLVHDEGLRAHILETTPGTQEEREREYYRVKKAVGRFAQHAREIIDADPDKAPTAHVRQYLEKRHGITT